MVKKIFQILTTIFLSILLVCIGYSIYQQNKYTSFVLEKKENIQNFSVESENINPNINITDICEYDSKSIFLINEIQNKIEKYRFKTDDTVSIVVNTIIEQIHMEELQSYFLMEYGFCDVKDAILIRKGAFLDYIMIDIDMRKFNSAERKMERVNQEVELMKQQVSGTDDYEKLKSISDIVVATIEYTSGYRDLYSVVTENKGVCNSYTLMMKKLCESMGYRSDMCFGYVEESHDTYHTWNKILLSDGTYQYFDLTAYDTSKNERDLFMTESPYPIVTINKYFFEMMQETSVS